MIINLQQALDIINDKNEEIYRLRQILNILWDELSLREKYYLSNGIKEAIKNVLDDIQSAQQEVEAAKPPNNDVELTDPSQLLSQTG